MESYYYAKHQLALLFTALVDAVISKDKSVLILYRHIDVE